MFVTELQSRPYHVAVVTGGARGIGSGVVKMMMQCDMHVVIGELVLNKDNFLLFVIFIVNDRLI